MKLKILATLAIAGMLFASCHSDQKNGSNSDSLSRDTSTSGTGGAVTPGGSSTSGTSGSTADTGMTNTNHTDSIKSDTAKHSSPPANKVN